MKPVAHVSNGIQFTGLSKEMRQTGLSSVMLYDLPYTDLSAYAGVVLTNYIDEEYLYEHRSIIHHFLQSGGVVCSFAEPYLPWLPGGVLWQRSPIPLKDREIIVAGDGHPIFQDIDPYDLNYKEGVRGFFSRGYFEMPDGAEPIIVDQSGSVIMYSQRLATGGTVLAGAGGDPAMFSSPGNTSRAAVPQLVNWIRAERARNEGRHPQ
ncbi:aspartate/tyrosine/aromatic aminotransferase [Cohnella faecalis]|uniref:Aspartate/tyrosine/aromatic aminotransferase n=1 Tax=Cohnella faecalis TaxID=2315694 RepID=A0A398CPG1_9BACL|nr:aspartate/tyrosine/aromatic aminotransferase [Cohnella faecalis]RIE04050.1 aspartate/tyrosine/aromatic aminotransferase [Cohnella faecalis]